MILTYQQNFFLATTNHFGTKKVNKANIIVIFLHFSEKKRGEFDL